MKRRNYSKLFWRVFLPGSGLFVLGGCNALSDAQLTSILQSAIGTAMNAFVTNLISTLFSSGTGA